MSKNPLLDPDRVWDLDGNETGAYWTDGEIISWHQTAKGWLLVLRIYKNDPILRFSTHKNRSYGDLDRPWVDCLDFDLDAALEEVGTFVPPQDFAQEDIDKALEFIQS